MSTEEKKVSASAILGMLEAGKTREEIGTELGLSKAQTRAVFQHPSLKGRKTKVNHMAGIEFIDDVPAKEVHEATASADVVDTGKRAKSTPKAAEPATEEKAAVAESEQLEDGKAEPIESASPWDRKG